MRKPKILDLKVNSFMTKTSKNIGKGLPQMDYTLNFFTFNFAFWGTVF